MNRFSCFVIATFLLSILLGSACTAPKTQNTNGQQSPSGVSGQPAMPLSSAVTKNSVVAQGPLPPSSPPTVVGKVPSNNELDQLGRMLASSAGDRPLVAADDFGGGASLTGLMLSGANAFDAIDVAQKAIDSIKSGKLDNSIFSDSARVMLEPDLAELSEAFKRATTARFLASHVLDDSGAAFRIHLMGKDLSAFAEITLQKGVSWKVEDLQADMNALSNMSVPDYNNYTPQDDERRMIREGNAGSWP